MQYTYTGAKIKSDMHKERTFFFFYSPRFKSNQCSALRHRESAQDSVWP